MRKSIIYITDSDGYGGSEKYILDVAVAASRIFDDVSVALTYKSSNLEFRNKLDQCGIKVLHVQQYRANYPLNFWAALRFLLAHDAMLLHFSLPSMHSCRWFMLAAALLKRTYFITEHSILASPFVNGWYVLLAHLLFNPLRRFLYRRSFKVLTVSKANANLLRKIYGMPADKLLVIHNGIDCAAFEPENGMRQRMRKLFDIPDDSKVLIAIGRLSREKGQQHLVRAVEKLSPMERTGLIVLLVGDGPLRETLEEEVRSRQLTHCIKFTGFRNDVPDILSIGDVFVLPSELEGFPYTILEAMAARMPVIATNVGGNREAVLDGVTGTIVEPAHVGQLALAIKDMLDHADKRARMGLSGRQRVNDLFTKDKIMECIFAQYECSCDANLTKGNP